MIAKDRPRTTMIGGDIAISTALTVADFEVDARDYFGRRRADALTADARG